MTEPTRDLTGGLLAFGFLLLLLASEAALTLPDQTDNPAAVAAFYAANSAAIIILQIIGFAAAALLASYTLRLEKAYPAVAWTGVVAAVLACAPGVVTLILAVVADTATPGTVATWNELEAQADDLLFLGVVAFGTAVAIQLTSHPVARILGTATAVLSAVRLATEAAGQPRGILDSLAPITFLLLVGTLGILSARGRLTAGSKSGVGCSPKTRPRWIR